MIEFISAHWLDMLTTLLGLAYILLEYKASAWLWVVGFVMQALGIVLYYQKGLYADCAMEFYYLAMTVYGFSNWVYGAGERGKDNKPAAITHFPRRAAIVWCAIAAALWGLIYYLLVTFTDSTVPVADSFTTALSLVGIWALARKYLEQWLVWIMVDVVTCALYYYKDIPFKATLYGLYVVIAVAGYFRWRRLMREEAKTSKKPSPII